MIVKNPALLKAYRAKPCEICGSTTAVSGHHIITKGSNGGHLDIEENLIALCFHHHRAIHDIDTVVFCELFPVVNGIFINKGFFQCELTGKWKKAKE